MIKMLDLPQIPPPPRGGKYSVPGPGNDTRKEASDFYESIIAVMASRWRVITCRNGIQWILQRRTAEPLHKGIWRGQSYFTSREALLEACARRELLFDGKARALLEALPDLISQHSK